MVRFIMRRALAAAGLLGTLGGGWGQASEPVRAKAAEPALPRLVVSVPAAMVRERDRILAFRMTPPYETIEALTSSTGFVERWNLGDPRAFFRFGQGLLLNPVCAWLPNDPLIVCHNFAATEVFDANDGHEVRTLEPGGGESWPFVCADDGTCAWQRPTRDHHELIVQNAKAPSVPRRVDLGRAQSIAVAITAAGRVVAIATTDRKVVFYGLADAPACGPIELPDPEGGASGPPVMTIGTKELQQLEWPAPSLFLPMRAAATALAFDPSGRRLAVGTTAGIHIVDMAKCAIDRTLATGGAPISALVFGRSRLVAAGADGRLLAWEAEGLREAMTPVPFGGAPASLALSSNEGVVAVLGKHARAEVIDLRRAVVAGTVAFLPEGRQWLAWTPQGLFTGSEGAWRFGSWRFDGKPDVAVPMETYYYDFFDAGLVGHLLNQDAPSASLAALSRDVPSVTLELLGLRPAREALVPLRGIVSEPAVATFRIRARPAAPNAGVSSVSVVHNGFVVRHFEPVRAPARQFEGELEIALHPGANTVEAYAFNRDGVRSPAASWERPQQGSGYRVPSSALRVLAVGISEYGNPAFNLRYAAADARLAESAMRIEAEALAQARSKIMSQPIDLFTSRLLVAPSRVEVTTLVNESATRDAILKAARDLAASATADDVVVVFIAGHGLRTESPDRYYFLPYDMRLRGKATDQTPEALAAATPSMISDSDLAQALDGLVARHSALIVDSCHSGALARGAELVGPLRQRTFARLAYEKGMHIVASTLSEQAANEPSEIGHGVLAYALFSDGLLHDLADWAPADGLIEFDEWLSYGARRAAQFRQSGGARRPPDQAPRYVPSVLPQREGIVLRAKLDAGPR